MQRLPLIILAVTAILVIGGVFFLTSKSPAKDPKIGLVPDAYTYFWSLTCSHCKNVADFLDTWQNPGINIDKKEVSQNRANAELLTEVATQCKIPADQVGVPLLVTPQGKCINGDTPIIDYFKNLFPESTPSAGSATSTSLSTSALTTSTPSASPPVKK